MGNVSRSSSTRHSFFHQISDAFRLVHQQEKVESHPLPGVPVPGTPLEYRELHRGSPAGQSRILHDDCSYSAGTDTGEACAVTIPSRKSQVCFNHLPPSTCTSQRPSSSHQAALSQRSSPSPPPGTQYLHQELHSITTLDEQQTPHDPRVFPSGIHRRLPFGLGIPLPAGLPKVSLVATPQELSHKHSRINNNSPSSQLH